MDIHRWWAGSPGLPAMKPAVSDCPTLGQGQFSGELRWTF